MNSMRFPEGKNSWTPIEFRICKPTWKFKITLIIIRIIIIKNIINNKIIKIIKILTTIVIYELCFNTFLTVFAIYYN